MKILQFVFLVLLIAHLASIVMVTGGAINTTETTKAMGTITLDAAGGGYPWINLSDGRDLPIAYTGPAGLRRVLEQNLADPLALASGDFDENGVPDLVSGYIGPSGGIIALHRGNVAAIWPRNQESGVRSQKSGATDSGQSSPFLAEAQVFEVPELPDFLGAGDLDADGHWDVVAGARGSDALYLLLGDGRGDFASAKQIKLPGAVTALVTGEINRADGLTDVVVGIVGPDGPQALVFESPDGALRGKPEIFSLPTETTALALGQLDESVEMDLAVAAGSDLLIVHGRDRSNCGLRIAACGLEKPQSDQLSFPFTIISLALGDFVWDREHQTEIALLADDGAVRVLTNPNRFEVNAGAHGEAPVQALGTDAHTVRAAVPGRPPLAHHLTERQSKMLAAGPWPQAAQLVRGKVSSLRTDDLVVVDPANHQLFILTPGNETESDNPHSAFRILQSAAPVTVLPMRLNEDALTDLVILRDGSCAPAVVLTAPMATFTVTNTNNSGAGSLRQAILGANASPGADMINFSVGSGGKTINLTSALPTITDAVTIDGTTQPGFAGEPIINLNGAATSGGDGLSITAGRCAVRGLVINNFRSDGIELTTNGGNVIEGNFIGTDLNGTADQGNAQQGVLINGSSGNTIGGATPSAGNLISGNDFSGVAIVGGASGNIVQGNFIGTDLTGASDLGNSLDNVFIDGSRNNTVGGTMAGARNIISGSDNFYGVEIFGGGATGNLVQGNYIGTDVTGTADRGNTRDGVLINGGSANTIGGTAAEAGNLISGNDFSGVAIAFGATRNLVQGNLIGTDVTGSADRGNNRDGVFIGFGASNNTIGGAATRAGNLISGNNSDGVEIFGSDATMNLVQGNFIGTSATGTTAVGNSFGGVFCNGASNNTIGGTTPEARNIISGNRGPGAWIDGSSSTQNLIQGNYIGTDLTGTDRLANGSDGVLVNNAGNNTIGGTVANARNVISGNNRDGIRISGDLAVGTQVLGNFIGTDTMGAAALGNLGFGVYLTDAAYLNTIGGTTAGATNVISGNDKAGIGIYSVATNNQVQGNLIGTDVTGTAALGNLSGIIISEADSNLIGGTQIEAQNLISGNFLSGVEIIGSGASFNLVQGNFIGLQIDGTSPLGNAEHGASICFSATQNTIGGITSGAGNRIAFNGGDGVSLTAGEFAAGNGNAVRANSIYSNTGLGIKLGQGTNNNQTAPVLTSAAVSGESLTIQGTINSTPDTTFTLEFFSNAECDPSAKGEGKTFLGAANAKTDSHGTANFMVSFAVAVSPGQRITATVTDANNNTSEFSQCAEVMPLTSQPPMARSEMSRRRPGPTSQGRASPGRTFPKPVSRR
ncbi:MAG: hypothetical protein HY314_17610 [Acidobacteria bacterium]|nr:hypothetical protein [Acidobacteriota bacterium]